jgi:hypothetical protein
MASTTQIARVVGSAWRLNVGWWALRIGLGVGPIIAGIDKYFNKLADWGIYLSPLARKVIPVSATICVVHGASPRGWL